MFAQASQTPRPGLHAVGCILNKGRYRVAKRLNKGATAIVYAAEDLLTGRPVALKVVQCGSNKVPLNVVRREVSLSSSVAHENMVQLLDVFAEGTELIIVWELITGGDLLELLNECNGCMTETAGAFYFTQLLRGVLHMHAMGYCHRDIKPENCMIEASTQRLKLIDFGLSKHLESVATLGVGTPDYMPPEMVRSQMKQQQPHSQPGPPPYDAKAVDAWAMGVLLYLLVTGCYPFEDPSQPNNLAATLLNVQAGRCRPLPETLSTGCMAVIQGLLCADPDRRTLLEDLAFNPWLLQSAAAHAAKLGPLGAQFDPGNPQWILPAVHLTAPASPPPMVASRHSNNSTSSTTSPLMASAPSPVPLNMGAATAGPTPGAAAVPGLVGMGFQEVGAPHAHHSRPWEGMLQPHSHHQHHQYAQQQGQQLLGVQGHAGAAVGAVGSSQQQQQQAWLLQQQQQQQAIGGHSSNQSFSSAAAPSHSALRWHSITSSRSEGLQEEQSEQPLVTGFGLRQQLAVNSAPGLWRPLSPALNPAANPAAGSSAYLDPVSSGQGGLGAYGVAPGVVCEDGMDVDEAGESVAGHTVRVLVGDAGGYGTDQGNRVLQDGHEGKERRTGFNWLQNLVRKRA